jgi:hypothetical protein
MNAQMLASEDPMIGVCEVARPSRRVFLRQVGIVTVALAARALVAPPITEGATRGDVVRVQGEFRLGPDSDGIDPVNDPVALRLLVPPGDRVYPWGVDFMPVTGFVRTPGGWALSRAEKARTGLETFTIRRTAEAGRFTFELVDRRTDLADRDYGVVWVELTIGADGGEADEALVERRGNWTLLRTRREANDHGD